MPQTVLPNYMSLPQAPRRAAQLRFGLGKKTGGEKGSFLSQRGSNDVAVSKGNNGCKQVSVRLPNVMHDCECTYMSQTLNHDF